MRQSRREFLKLFGGMVLSNGLGASEGFCDPLLQEFISPSLTTPKVDWNSIRGKLFSLSPDYVYMNNSTLGTTLKPVQRKIAAVQDVFSKGCYLSEFLQQVVFAMGPLREKIRRVINAHDDGSSTGRYIGLVDSVTDGMSLIANGLTFEAGDAILTTDHEHTGGYTMWELQRDRYRSKLVQIPLLIPGQPEDEWKASLLERFEKAFQKHEPKVLSFSWITTSTGHILPAKELCELASRYGAISVIDGAQAFGILPMDVTELDCDFLVCNGHKYLCGPVGTGFISVHPRRLEAVS